MCPTLLWNRFVWSGRKWLGAFRPSIRWRRLGGDRSNLRDYGFRRNRPGRLLCARAGASQHSHSCLQRYLHQKGLKARHFNWVTIQAEDKTCRQGGLQLCLQMSSQTSSSPYLCHWAFPWWLHCRSHCFLCRCGWGGFQFTRSMGMGSVQTHDRKLSPGLRSSFDSRRSLSHALPKTGFA